MAKPNIIEPQVDQANETHGATDYQAHDVGYFIKGQQINESSTKITVNSGPKCAVLADCQPNLDSRVFAIAQ